jgi:hypothetical protein
LGNSIIAKGKNFGIYATKKQWIYIFGSDTACQETAKFLLWNASKDTEKFGGWIKVYRQFGGTISKCTGNP